MELQLLATSNPNEKILSPLCYSSSLCILFFLVEATQKCFGGYDISYGDMCNTSPAAQVGLAGPMRTSLERHAE